MQRKGNNINRNRITGFGMRLAPDFGLAEEVSMARMVQVSHGDIVGETLYACGAVARPDHRQMWRITFRAEFAVGTEYVPSKPPCGFTVNGKTMGIMQSCIRYQEWSTIPHHNLPTLGPRKGMLVHVV